MKLKYLGKGVISIGAKEGAALVSTLSIPDRKKVLEKQTAEIVIDPFAKEEMDQKYLISHPGEYELKDIFVNAYITDRQNEDPDLFLVASENVTVVIVSKRTKEIHNELLDDLGVVDLLVLSVADDTTEEEKEDLAKLANKIDPMAVIIVSEDSKFDDFFKNAVGSASVEIEKTLQVKEADFADEESTTRLIRLEKTS